MDIELSPDRDPLPVAGLQAPLSLPRAAFRISQEPGSCNGPVINQSAVIRDWSTDLQNVLSFAETIVIGNKDAEFKDIMNKLTKSQVVIDFVRISDRKSDPQNYDGICW